jgi:hypothetical protein
MRPQLMVSVLATFEGINPVDWYPCESYIREMVPKPEHGLHCTEEEVYESEWCEGLWEPFNIAPEDEEERIEAEEKLEAEGKWKPWDELMKVEVAGIVPLDDALDYLEQIGAIFEDCQTMGTLGGPLGIGIVPDMAFRTESQLVVSSIRITPFWNDNGDWSPLSEASWERLRELFRRHDLWTLRKMANNRVQVEA